MEKALSMVESRKRELASAGILDNIDKIIGSAEKIKNVDLEQDKVPAMIVAALLDIATWAFITAERTCYLWAEESSVRDGDVDEITV